MTAPVPGPPAPAGQAQLEAVAQAVQQLDGLDARPLTEHVAVLDGVHRALQDALAALDEA